MKDQGEVRMIGCEEAERRLHGYLDRELSETEATEVRQHLAVCDNCRARFRFEEGVSTFSANQAQRRQAGGKPGIEPQGAVLDMPTCGYCRQAKRFLKEHGVAYTEVDVSSHEAAAQEIVRRTRQYGVPVIDVGGTLVIGFDVRRLDDLLHAA